jgi:hypothetical protein
VDQQPGAGFVETCTRCALFIKMYRCNFFVPLRGTKKLHL